ncbi:hypothetical protein TRICHSKD4_4644 [Roseibium sp. TrichSKD4]|nr:hypothetical protein TRICHSKD4_4644 [Roseibium sp. TrichSKD4]
MTSRAAFFVGFLKDARRWARVHARCCFSKTEKSLAEFEL